MGRRLSESTPCNCANTPSAPRKSMNTTKRELTPKKPYVKPVLNVHGDLRTLTQSGSVGRSETLGLKLGCFNIRTRRC